MALTHIASKLQAAFQIEGVSDENGIAAQMVTERSFIQDLMLRAEKAKNAPRVSDFLQTVSVADNVQLRPVSEPEPVAGEDLDNRRNGHGKQAALFDDDAPAITVMSVSFTHSGRRKIELPEGTEQFAFSF
jgi:hypothetical protein